MSVASIDPAVMPILDEALELAESALLAQQSEQKKIAAKEQENATLRQQLADQERVILEKVAKQRVLNPIELDRLFDQFENLNILTPKERVKLASHIQRDPNLLLPMFQKAAEMLTKAPGEGSGLDKEDGSQPGGGKDPDGWDDL